MLKRKMLVLMSLSVVLAMASAAGAQEAKGKRGGPEGDGQPGFCALKLNLTAEQNAKIKDLHNAFFKDTVELRSDIFRKEQEMDALLMEPSIAVEKAKKLQDELSGLKAQMAQKSLQAQLDARKVLTPEQVKQLPPGCTMGFGPGGKGGGMGHSCGMGAGGGKGPGAGKGKGSGGR